MITRQLLALAAACVLPLPTFAADGAALFKASCVACHGATGAGNAALQAPPLAGLDEGYAARQLRHFRTGVRGGEGAGVAMRAVAKALPGDTEVAALARYIASLKPVALRAESGATPALLNDGKALFAVCVACHGNNGEGNRALQAPRLTQLPAWYLTTQLQAFRTGPRGVHADDGLGQQMRQVVSETLVDDAAVQAVAVYITSLGTARARR